VLFFHLAGVYEEEFSIPEELFLCDWVSPELGHKPSYKLFSKISVRGYASIQCVPSGSIWVTLLDKYVSFNANHLDGDSISVLVYIDETLHDFIMQPIDIPPLLMDRLNQEKIISREYFTLRLIFESDLKNYKNKLGLINLEKVQRKYKVNRYASLVNFKQAIYTKFSILPPIQQYWGWIKRQNQTIRPHLPFTEKDLKQFQTFSLPSSQLKLLLITHSLPSINILSDSIGHSFTHHYHTNIHCNNKSECHSFLPKNQKVTNILVFFKYFDPETDTLSYVGNAILSEDLKPPDIHKILKNMAYLADYKDLVIYEEVHSNLIEILLPNRTLGELEIINGDILVFQCIPQSFNARSIFNFYAKLRQQ